MEEKKEPEKKLIIDEDWKNQAQADKEKLDKEVAQEQEAQPERGAMPEGNFISLVNLLVTQAYMALGLIRHKDEKEMPPDLEYAKYSIDTLGDLELKTKGNLSPEEEEMLRTALHSLRMLFVQLTGKK